MFHLIKCSDVASPFVLQGKLCSFMASRTTVTAFPLSFLPDLASLKVELEIQPGPMVLVCSFLHFSVFPHCNEGMGYEMYCTILPVF